MITLYGFPQTRAMRISWLLDELDLDTTTSLSTSTPSSIVHRITLRLIPVARYLPCGWRASS